MESGRPGGGHALRLEAQRGMRLPILLSPGGGQMAPQPRCASPFRIVETPAKPTNFLIICSSVPALASLAVVHLAISIYTDNSRSEIALQQILLAYTKPSNCRRQGSQLLTSSSHAHASNGSLGRSTPRRQPQKTAWAILRRKRRGGQLVMARILH